MGRSGDDNRWEEGSVQWWDLGGEERRKGRGWVLNRSVYQKPSRSVSSPVQPLVPTVQAQLKSWLAQGARPHQNGGQVAVVPAGSAFKTLLPLESDLKESIRFFNFDGIFLQPALWSTLLYR